MADKPDQVQAVADGLQALADRLSLDERFSDAREAVGGVQTIRALWTMLQRARAASGKPPAEIA